MMKLLFGLGLLVLLANDAPVAQASGCGLPPMTPLPQLGCRAMRPVCVCDSTGRICGWEFECVR